MNLLTNSDQALIFNHLGYERIKKGYQRKIKERTKEKKEIEVGTKEFTNGREFFFDIWTEYNKIQKNTTDDISIKRILEKYQREDEGREAGRNGN